MVVLGICEAEAGAGTARLIHRNACCKRPSLWGPLSSTTGGAGKDGACSKLCSFFENLKFFLILVKLGFKLMWPS